MESVGIEDEEAGQGQKELKSASQGGRGCEARAYH